MLSKLVIAVVVAILVTLGASLVGTVLAALEVEIAVTVGRWLVRYAPVLGVLAGLYHFFAGGTWPLKK